MRCLEYRESNGLCFGAQFLGAARRSPADELQGDPQGLDALDQGNENHSLTAARVQATSEKIQLKRCRIKRRQKRVDLPLLKIVSTYCFDIVYDGRIGHFSELDTFKTRSDLCFSREVPGTWGIVNET